MSKRCLTCYYHKQRWEEAEGENRRLKAENERLRLAHEEITDLPNRTGGWIYAADISRAALESNDE